jgi:superfamily II DNA helicase RecQ
LFQQRSHSSWACACRLDLSHIGKPLRAPAPLILVLTSMTSVEIVPANSNSETELLATLRRYWGYTTFRPLQESIVGSLLGGHDTCVVMPTGGGKSLCYQLPAVMLGRTAVVVSPLIALMQDQSAQLAQMGIPAGVLNSSMPNEKQAEIMRRASHGDFRLLYLSPERLARADTISWLQSVPVAFFAIDEAHCISEWGHEFRPEYRQLSRLRAHFPDRPIFTSFSCVTRTSTLPFFTGRISDTWLRNVRAASSPACCSAPCATIRAAASSCTRRRSPK